MYQKKAIESLARFMVSHRSGNRVDWDDLSCGAKDEAIDDAKSAISWLSQQDAFPYQEALSDLTSLRAEQNALSGGGPGFAERWEKAWLRAEDLVRNEP